MSGYSKLAWGIVSVLGAAGIAWLARDMPFGDRTYVVMGVCAIFVLVGLFPDLFPFTKNPGRL
jgi:hypothetical protein